MRRECRKNANTVEETRELHGLDGRLSQLHKEEALQCLIDSKIAQNNVSFRIEQGINAFEQRVAIEEACFEAFRLKLLKMEDTKDSITTQGASDTDNEPSGKDFGEDDNQLREKLKKSYNVRPDERFAPHLQELIPASAAPQRSLPVLTRNRIQKVSFLLPSSRRMLNTLRADPSVQVGKSSIDVATADDLHDIRSYHTSFEISKVVLPDIAAFSPSRGWDSLRGERVRSVSMSTGSPVRRSRSVSNSFRL